MPKLRKMLGDVNSPECVSLMKLIETQSQATLSSWAVSYAKDNYLPIYESQYPGDFRLRDILSACEEYLRGRLPLRDLKPSLRDAAQIARDAADHPIAQAAARAVSTACATVQTPTNALGFLFYGAAAAAYSGSGLTQPPETYDTLATAEFEKAHASLQHSSIPNDPTPVKINWHC